MGTRALLLTEAPALMPELCAMRDKAQELEQAEQHATDPAERQRLKDRAMRIREKSEQEHGRGSGTMDPM
ncbi:DUF6381 family protein [Streptomyces sp. NPDC085929]|uniref:DUF6381 family protein n=1 Tax=Streptomyces sp. NPDC085929 TaxID=3365739 RepID=UPI0037D7D8AD